MKIKSLFDSSLFNIRSSVGKISLWSLLFPILFESATSTVLSTVNTAVISRYSEDAAAAIGACTPIIAMLLLVQSVVSLGSTVIISNNIGAKDIRSAREVSYTGAFISAFCALFMIPVVLIFSSGIMTLQNLNGEIFDIAVKYFRIRVIFLVSHALCSYFCAVLRCYGYARYTFYVGVINNVLNLIFSLISVNISGIEAESAVEIMALGCGVASTVSLICVIFFLKKRSIGINKPRALADFFGAARRILNIGVPSAISSMTFTASQIVTTAFVVMISGYALTAKVIYTQILSYAYLFSYSAGSANAVLIGIRCGAGEYDEMNRMNRHLFRITCIVNLIVSLSIVAFRVPLVSVFTENAEIIALAAGVFAVDILTEQGRAVSHVYEYALRSVGDVWMGLVALVSSCLVFGIGLSYLLAIGVGLGLVGCWIGLAADECFRAVFMYGRWRVVLARLQKKKSDLPQCSKNNKNNISVI